VALTVFAHHFRLCGARQGTLAQALPLDGKMMLSQAERSARMPPLLQYRFCRNTESGLGK
jgi:hypothetical protein